MTRLAISALALSAIACPAVAQTAGPEPGPVPVCNDITNGDFSIGSAFWSVDIETGEFGDTGAGVFTSFTPLSLLPNNGNVATFFTEALAEGDCEFQLGSAANSTVLFSRRLVSAPSGRLRFQFGGQLSFIVVGDAEVRYSITLIVRNETTGQEAKCRLASGRVDAAEALEEGLPGIEGVINIPFQNFNICNCQNLLSLATAGDTIEILLIPSVRSDAPSEGTSAFIGGPLFFDNVRFCNILCPVPIPEPIPAEFVVAETMMDSRPLNGDLTHLTSEQLRLRVLDANNDGVVTLADIKPFPDLTEPSFDVNGDGKVTLDDAYIIVDILDANRDPVINADVNGDGRVDESDLKLILELAELR